MRFGHLVSQEAFSIKYVWLHSLFVIQKDMTDWLCNEGWTINMA